MPFAAFTHQVRSPRNEMPPYTAKVLSDADLADIYAFVALSAAATQGGLHSHC